MSNVRLVRGALRLLVFAIVLCVCTPSLATITFSSNTLTYSSPSDLGTTIDPSGQKDVTNSYGITKSSFQALSPKVVAFNGAPSPTQTLRTLVVNYTAGSTVTFTFPAAMYNYGSMTTYGRGSFSGSAAQDAISTVPVQNSSLYDWFDASITGTGGQGVQSLGFCAAFRNDQAVTAGQVLYTLSDATTATITLPALGGSGNPQLVFIGYTAPSGKTITRVQASRTSGPGGGYVSVDDLSFVMSPDTTAPAAVSNLAAGSPTTTSVQLSWTAPGDDTSTGTAASYDIRYSTSTITTGNWASATQVSGEPTPAIAGTNQNMTVGGLSADTTYYFAMMTSDEVPNVSALSNVPSQKTSDTTAPAAVANLAAGSPTTTSIVLSWTAPGDNGSTGTATSYDIRYSTSTITTGNWASATQVSGEPTPAAAGTNQNMTVGGLSADTTYYFAIITSDEVPNASALSNVPSGTTSSGGGSLPAPWQRIDIGAVGATGTASYSAPTFTIEGSGADIWDTVDEFCYVYQSLSGDGSIVARVASVENTNGWAKAGVMIRESLAAGSRNAAIVVTPSNGTSFQWRTSTDGGSNCLASPSAAAPRYVKIQRSGSNFSTYESSDGSTWNQLGSTQSISMGASVYMGLCVTSHADGALCTGTFDNVSVIGGADTTAPAAVTNLATGSPTSSSIALSWTAPGDDGSTGTAASYDIRYRTGGAVDASNWASATQVAGEPTPAVAGTNQNMVVSGLSASTTYYFAIKASDEVPNTAAISNSPSGTTSASGSLPSPWQRTDIGAVGATGTASYSAPTFTIEGSGADIWGSADEFCFVYQGLSGDGSIVARVASVENTDVWAKAGVMIRESLAADSKNATIDVTPGQVAVFQWRAATGGASSYASSPGIMAPRYVKLQRSGNDFTAYESSNGTSWNQVGTTQSITMASSVWVGLCVTAHNNSTLCTATFDNVSLTTGGGDTTAPAAVINLATSNPTSSSITLTWTAPGDDSSTGTAASYDIRYRTGGAVDASNWASATQVTGEPTPVAAGAGQSMTISGLLAGTTYYFAIKTSDEVPNTSDLSNSPSGTTTSGSSGTGLKGDYYNNNDFTSFALTRTDATVNFSWGPGSPDGSIGADTFSVRWTGQVQAQYSETYTFYAVSDDGVRLWVDGQQLINNWTPHGSTEDSGQITLVAGQKYNITMEYYEGSGDAEARLRWSSPSTTKVAIPQSQLYPTMGGDTTAPAAVINLATSNPTSSSITLTWTAPGDDSSTGTAASYDIRYRTGGVVDESNWASAKKISGEPVPAVAGTSQSMTVRFLPAGYTYYFAIKTADEVPNISVISNSPSGTTLPGTPNNKPILGPRDFKYKGYYRLETNYSMFQISVAQGLTHRYVGGQLRFLTLSMYDDGVPPNWRLIEFAPPANLGGTVTARTNYWPDIWAGTGQTNGTETWFGLWYEQAQDRLWTTWGIDYPDTPQEESATISPAIRTLNSNGTISNVAGPWGLEGIQQRRIYGGIQAVPSWFQNTYGAGLYCTGWGGYASRMALGVSLGPTFYTFPEPTAYPAGDNAIPTTDFRTIMDHSASTLGWCWYPPFSQPTSHDRGVRNSDIYNEVDMDKNGWLSPAPDGLGRQTMGDSNYQTGCWIETPNKQGFILIPLFVSGRVWYENSSGWCQRRTSEIQVYDPHILGEAAVGTRPVWNCRPTAYRQITDDFRPLGCGWGNAHSGPMAATYDSTTQTLYVLCAAGSNQSAYILLYDVDLQPASVDDVAYGDTAATGTVGTTVPPGPINFAITQTNDSVYQTVQEVVQGSTSQLEHKWTFNVTAGSSIIFRIKAYKTSNSEGDDFVFACSTNGTSWTNMVTVSRTTDDGTFQTYTMPGGTSGTVYVRVQDTDRTSGRNNLDTIYVDEMMFRSAP